MKASKPEDVNMSPVGFRITMICIDYAQKLPGHWVTLPYNRGCFISTLLVPDCRFQRGCQEGLNQCRIDTWQNQRDHFFMSFLFIVIIESPLRYFK